VRRADLARACFALTAATVVAGLTIQVCVAASAEQGRFSTGLGRAANVFAYFTIQSNVLVGVACLLLALRLTRGSAAFAWLRMTGLVAIAVTALVYYAVLADFSTLAGWHLAADVIVHGVVPLLALGGWAAFGPRGIASRRTALLALAFPVVWLTFSLIRGELDGFYPYPFVDVDRHGYAVVLLNSLGIGTLVVALGIAAAALDIRLARRD
jgi:hypothetical protein